MKTKMLFGLMLLFMNSSLLLAQIGERRDFVWLLGYDYDLTTSEQERILLDFNTSPISIEQIDFSTSFYLTKAVISNKEGNLLFYTNGCHIANAVHDIMENGEGLNPGEIHDNVCSESGYSIPQGAVIIPFPDEPDKYYLFHQRIKWVYEPEINTVIDRLFYSVIDMSLNNGLGAVVQKNEVAIADTLYGGHLTAAKHANGRWWWIMVPQRTSNFYYRLLIKDSGDIEIQSQEIGLPTTELGDGSGQAVFSPDGKHYIRYNMIDQLYMFDFDRKTGLLSNFRQVEVDTNGYQGGVAVSSNSRFLYVSPLYKVYQFDLWAQDISATKVQVAEFDGYTSPFPTLFWFMQLGPDCRIYIDPPNGTNVMHVIQYPNEKGIDCQVDQHTILLPSFDSSGTLNFPNYRLGTGEPVCDPSISTSLPFLQPSAQNGFELSPNPASGEVLTRFPENSKMEGEIIVHDAFGREVSYLALSAHQDAYWLDISMLAPGIYFITWQQEGQQVKSQKLVISR